MYSVCRNLVLGLSVLSSLAFAGPTFPSASGKISIPSHLNETKIEIGVKIEVSCNEYDGDLCFEYEDYVDVKNNGEFTIPAIQIQNSRNMSGMWGPRVEYRLVAKINNRYMPVDDRAYDFTWYSRSGAKTFDEYFFDYKSFIEEADWQLGYAEAYTISLDASEDKEFIEENIESLEVMTITYIDGQYFENFVSYKGMSVQEGKITIPGIYRLYNANEPEMSEFNETFPKHHTYIVDGEFDDRGNKTIHFSQSIFEDGTIENL